MQIMRRKVFLILAVPLLFMISIVFLMSDIKNIPETSGVVTKENPRLEQKRPKHKPPPPHKGNKNNNNNNEDDSPFKDKNNKFDTNDYDATKSNKKTDKYDDDDQAPFVAPKPNKAVEKAKDKEEAKEEVLSDETKRRQQAVKDAYLHAWHSYEQYAYGSDELRPPFREGMGLTIVDSIDTMWLMGLKDEYAKARTWIINNLRFDSHREISFFETTIRVVGGLVSIYDLTGDKVFLDKAEELGKLLMPVFNTPSGYAYTTINVKTGRATNPAWAMSSAILSETGTVQVEYSALSERTGNKIFRDKAMKVYDKLDEIGKPDGLYPVYLDIHGGGFANNRVTLGALGDSYYEYLLKIWILTGKSEDKMYEEATDAVISKLVKKSTPGGLTYIAEKDNGNIVDKMDHLVCFAGAMFALGAYHNATTNTAEHMELGKEITRTCHEFYVRQETGLGPEIANFAPGKDFYAPGSAHHYILRPETVESYFVLYWLTQDTKYQDWGWEAFQAIEQHCRTPQGYCGVRDVTHVPVEHDDVQQSFFMAETLKYLYLLFSPRSTVDLNDWVFNTEAHPIKVWKD